MKILQIELFDDSSLKAHITHLVNGVSIKIIDKDSTHKIIIFQGDIEAINSSLEKLLKNGVLKVEEERGRPLNGDDVVICV